MPNGSAAWVGNSSTHRKSRGGLGAALSILGLCVAFAVTGCAGASTGTPTAAEQQITTQSTPTPESSASAADVTTAPATSAAPTTAPPKPAPPTSRAPAPAPARSAAPPRPSLCGAPQNPFGYNFCGRGGYISAPAGTACSYFDCIANFYNGSGYMVECSDGTYSMSGGRPGACSHHGGVSRPVYSG